MARYSPEHKEATRRRMIETAGRRFKSDGIDGSGIATLVADAGLTNGAFYGHFTSKDDRELDADEIVRGYEIEKDRFVIVDDDELERLAGERGLDARGHDLLGPARGGDRSGLAGDLPAARGARVDARGCGST